MFPAPFDRRGVFFFCLWLLPVFFSHHSDAHTLLISPNGGEQLDVGDVFTIDNLFICDLQ